MGAPFFAKLRTALISGSVACIIRKGTGTSVPICIVWQRAFRWTSDPRFIGAIRKCKLETESRLFLWAILQKIMKGRNFKVLFQSVIASKSQK
ncbi:hypothetical protein CEXT_459621 [Caerostris extrusa]|uniref:Uncharacterized protein n=1 Tax=Caerostris extrusa TaxID=172846 RepID=A0AAV4QUF0_CAEEX|nr:hypothetical protein CEXT_459621 [Caerostris extrusa]